MTRGRGRDYGDAFGRSLDDGFDDYYSDAWHYRPSRSREDHDRTNQEGRGERTGILRLRRDRGEDIWPDDGISDEDYWAAVTSDRPLGSMEDIRKHEPPLIAVAAPGKRTRRARVAPQKLTGLAVFIAGRKRTVLGAEWRAHLSGEIGTGLSVDRQTRDAAGFILAAIRFRLEDAADLAWRPVDAVLASRKLSNLAVLTVTIATALIFICQGRLYGVADNLGSVAVVWGAAFGLIHYGRQWRDIKPPERKPRRPKQ